jgi:hypothetical protein
MAHMIRAVLGWLTGGVLDRVFSTIDRTIEAQTDRERLKAEIIREHYRTRTDWMRAGGLWLMIAFAAPLSVWWSAVILYSILWCQRCAFPQSWSIAALPPPLDEWAGLIVVAIFGVIGVDRLRSRQ